MSPEPWQQKIHFDLSGIRADGLTGPADGLVSVSYEFCIPGKQQFLAEVLAIDSSIQYSTGSPGRVGCGESDYLCIGDTHKPNWREILQQIAALAYVKRIQRAWFE